MITVREARLALPEGYTISDKELESTLAYFYFLGEQAYEEARKEVRNE